VHLQTFHSTGVLISPYPDQEGNKLHRPNLTFASHSKTIQNVVRPTRSPRQQWPPRRTKNGELSTVFFQLVRAKDFSAPLYYKLILGAARCFRSVCPVRVTANWAGFLRQVIIAQQNTQDTSTMVHWPFIKNPHYTEGSSLTKRSEIKKEQQIKHGSTNIRVYFWREKKRLAVKRIIAVSVFIHMKTKTA
jgi:hypothetical protein